MKGRKPHPTRRSLLWAIIGGVVGSALALAAVFALEYWQTLRESDGIAQAAGRAAGVTRTYPCTANTGAPPNEAARCRG